jgi:hypothetical protein
LAAMNCEIRAHLHDAWAEAMRHREQAEIALEDYAKDPKEEKRRQSDYDALKAKEDAAYRELREHMEQHGCR